MENVQINKIQKFEVNVSRNLGSGTMKLTFEEWFPRI
jgi:hypothetical protein